MAGKYLDANGLSYLWGKIFHRLLPSGGSSGQVLAKSSGNDYDVGWTTPSGGGGSVTSRQIFLDGVSWSNNTATFNCIGVTASNNVIVAPDSATDEAFWVEYGLRCTGQGANQLTFSRTKAYSGFSTGCTVNVLILG